MDEQKHVARKMVEESGERIKKMKDDLVRFEILERYGRRQVLSRPTTDQNLALGKLQEQMRTTKAMVEKEEELQEFLQEVINEK